MPRPAPSPPVCGQTCEERSAGLALTLESLRRTNDALAEQARNDALLIGMEVAMHIIGREVKQSVQPLLGFIEQALRRLAESRSITVRVSPKDFAALGATRDNPFGIAGSARVQLVADATLGCGDCELEAELGSVDGRLITRLAALAPLVEAEASEAALGTSSGAR